MALSQVCLETENQSICLDPNQGDVLMSQPSEPDQTTVAAEWTPSDQVEWNRIATQRGSHGGGHHSSLGMRPPKILGFPFFLAGCGGDSSSDSGDLDGGETPEDELIDADGDGFYANGEDALDCDDGNANIHPTAEDLCDGVDDDCDGEIDGTVYYADLDGDGYGAGDVTATICEVEEGAVPGLSWVASADDCYDGDPAVNPSAEEVAGNDGDENCNGMGDADQDGDGKTIDQGDCADWDDRVYLGATELCADILDNNCNDKTNEGCSEEGEEVSCDEVPLKDGESWFQECCPDNYDEHTGTEGRYGSGEDHDSISGFSETIEDGCGRFLPGTANSTAFRTGDSFWIDSEESAAFCVSSGWSATDESCVGSSAGLVSPTTTDCMQHGSELAVAKLNFDDTGEPHNVVVNCGGQEYQQNDYVAVYDWPSIEVFLKPNDSGCSEVAWTNYPLWWVKEDGAASLDGTHSGVIYFAAAGPVPFACHVSLE